VFRVLTGIDAILAGKVNAPPVPPTAEVIAIRLANKRWIYYDFARWPWAAGFRSGPSRIQMAMSPELTKALSKTPAADGTVHITRGDGCINL
jgi:hypothetical protein